MTFSKLLIHDVVIFNPSGTTTDSRYGDINETFDAGTAVKGRVDLQDSNEQLADRDTRVTKAMLFLDPDVTISALSYWTWNGRKFKVSGEPKVLYDSDSAHHIEAESEEFRG